MYESRTQLCRGEGQGGEGGGLITPYFKSNVLF